MPNHFAPARPVRILLLAIPLVGVGAIAGWQAWGYYHLRSADRALAQRDFARARQSLSQALAVWPNDAPTLLLAARVARRGGADEAGRLLDSAARANAVPEAVALERTLLRFQSGDLTDAERYLAICEGHRDAPETPLILEALLEGAWKARRLDIASRCLRSWEDRATSVEDRAQGLVWRAELAIRTGDLDSAVGFLREAVEAAPGNEAARLRLGELLTSYAPAEALRHLEKLPRNRDVVFHLARCRRAMGQHEEASRLLDELRARSPRDVAVLLERGKVALDLLRLGEAERCFRDAEALAPERREVALSLARVFQLAGKESEARAYLDKVAKLDEALEQRARQLLEKGRLP